MFDKDDVEATVVKHLFNSLKFEFGGMATRPTGYKYDAAKDSIKWVGLKPRDYIPLLDQMFNSFVSKLPK